MTTDLITTKTDPERFASTVATYEGEDFILAIGASRKGFSIATFAKIDDDVFGATDIFGLQVFATYEDAEAYIAEVIE